MIDNITQPLIVTHTMPSRLYASDGTTLKQLGFRYSGYQIVNNVDGDKMFAYFTCKGNETKLYIRSFKDTNSGIWDLYVNNVLDSSGYDSYAAAVGVSLKITLTQPIKKGLNIIEFRVNGKNASSAGYKITISSMLVQ